MSIAEEMRSRLQDAFEPSHLEIIDDSESHRGHAGFREGGETHFKVAIKSPAFNELNRIARHRAVHSALGKDLVGRIHALELKIEV